MNVQLSPSDFTVNGVDLPGSDITIISSECVPAGLLSK